MPIGSLSLELSKLDHNGESHARRIFDLFRIWLRQQFKAMGRTSDADDLAMHVLGRSQGVATLANAYPAEDCLEREVQYLLAWLEKIDAATPNGA